MRVHKRKGLHVKPPDLGVGRRPALVVHRDGASHVVQRVGTSAEGGDKSDVQPGRRRLLQRLTRRTAASTQSVWRQGRRSNPARAGTAPGLETAERWRLPRTQLSAEARTAGAGLRERRM